MATAKIPVASIALVLGVGQLHPGAIRYYRQIGRAGQTD
jgi:hypothetical protein